MLGVNRVIIAGNLTSDPEMTECNNGTKVTEFTVALNRVYKDKNGEKREETCFMLCVAYGRKAENIHEYFYKGRPIFVEGILKQDRWEKDGKKFNRIKIGVDNFRFLDARRAEEQVEVEAETEAGTEVELTELTPGVEDYDFAS